MTAPSEAPSLPLVAIVTPVYNGAAYLRETMDAVRTQTYPNLVHIVLDNASTDATPAILAEYAGAPKRVQVFRNSALLPITENWNTALAHVPEDAKYFSVVCADDVIAPTFVQRMVELGEQRPSVGVMGSSIHFNQGPTIDMGWPDGQELFVGKEAMEMYFSNPSKYWLPSGHAFYRTAVIEPGKPFYRSHLAAQDIDATLRTLLSWDMGFLQDDLAMNREHAATLTNSALRKEKRHLYEWVYFLKRYGPIALGKSRARDALQLYNRCYLRQLARWGAGENKNQYRIHMQGLARLGVAPRAWNWVDAAYDWALSRISRRPLWVGYPYLY
jgi:glycosyltransferase involved in cell wall biosynthesis